MTKVVDKFASSSCIEFQIRSISEILIQMTGENLAFSTELIDIVKKISFIINLVLFFGKIATNTM